MEKNSLKTGLEFIKDSQENVGWNLHKIILKFFVEFFYTIVATPEKHMHGDKDLAEGQVDVCGCLQQVKLWVDAFYVFISFMVSNIVLIINKINKIVKMTFGRVSLWKAY